MKKIIFLFIAAVLMVSGQGLSKEAVAEDTKIGYADVALVFDSYNKTKDQDAVLSSESDKKKQQRDKMVEKIKNMKDELELLSDKKREEKQASIDEEVRRLGDFDQEAKGFLRRERDNMVRGILKEIDSVMKDYAQKNGYTIILNSRVLIYATKEYDVTQQIIDILNSNYKTKK